MRSCDVTLLRIIDQYGKMFLRIYYISGHKCTIKQRNVSRIYACICRVAVQITLRLASLFMHFTGYMFFPVGYQISTNFVGE